jgi:hypothetical protein
MWFKTNVYIRWIYNKFLITMHSFHPKLSQCLLISVFWKRGFNGADIIPVERDVVSDGWRPGWKLLWIEVGKLGWSPLDNEHVGSPHGHPDLNPGMEDGIAPRVGLSVLYLWANEVSIEVVSDVADDSLSRADDALSAPWNGGKVSNMGLSGFCGANGEKADEVCVW